MNSPDLSDKSSGSPVDARSLAELFHLVKSLIPEDQKLIVAGPEMRVAQAVRLMQRHNFSQLPVVAGRAVLGVFSFRSLTTRLLEMGKISEHFGDLPVDEFMVQFEFAQLSDNWESIVRHLDRDDGVLVGNRDELLGILTPMDVLSYLRDIASPFVLLAEIELSLRRIVGACVTGDEVQTCAQRCLTGKYPPDEIPNALSEMTFNDYVQIIGDGRNWPHFEAAFGKGDWQRKMTASRLREVRVLRNDVFHFKRRLLAEDMEKLTKRREWLQMKTRAFEAKRQEVATVSTDAEGPTPEDYHRLLTRRPIPRGQRQLYKALYDAGEVGLSHAELAETIGRDAGAVRGILGALGRRANKTPGYGQDQKPGSAMALSWEELDNGQWRLNLLPEMRSALEILDPDWLRKVG